MQHPIPCAVFVLVEPDAKIYDLLLALHPDDPEVEGTLCCGVDQLWKFAVVIPHLSLQRTVQINGKLSILFFLKGVIFSINHYIWGAKVESKSKFIPNPKKRLMDQVREVMRFHHYAYRTEQSYCQWIVRFIKFYDSKQHPREMGTAEVQAFLSHLASDREVAASTQKQALNALVFLYRHVIDQPLAQGMEPRKATKGKRPPTVLTEAEVTLLLAAMEEVHLLMARLMYGSRLRLTECIRLRVKDVYALGARLNIFIHLCHRMLKALSFSFFSNLRIHALAVALPIPPIVSLILPTPPRICVQ